MLKSRQSQKLEIENQLKSGRFKAYMTAWSIFFVVLIGATLFDNARSLVRGVETLRQSAALTKR